MLLWITESAELYEEPENVIIRKPEEISNIAPNAVSMVLMESSLPTRELMEWAENRRLPTLWWQPNVSVPADHCVVCSTDCDCKDFAFLLGRVCLRDGIVNLQAGELESAILEHSQMVIVPYIRLTEKSNNLQRYSLGYLIQQGVEQSFETFQKNFEQVKRTTAISELYTLLLEEDESDMVWAFRE
ncbi:hypothetical protein LRP50_20610 [Enterovibrio sp. ZSDZ42]|uniref:Uncharacterized protein n=1 Tax=Enterovibrio gelatinilyticus TaxID=2899819 RepID=A0ABT5R5H4_9GAMM|nr:hypothetical protein [Enterovibrio sp. ZSDZ42]MDD1795533.1 hypothetical protein [Enterovibrio sp. ZSDZ42]